ncbi:hypothetical protein SISNIDRAFT_480475 [Sistotremastrum niveocremeum HHB9708]|uniref:DUF6533 domain-containing protein n=1 Tax=Sistotremastrum niveocremeum HHB9708 TaxID=1314777 RepID=A0A165AEG1_9AGAM|nr:hypothetical protein SISNIDRAFT_480475 [Sistotremastrum niveocremeum HHB9708]
MLAMDSDVLRTAKLLIASKHSFHASFALLMWDHLITLDQEISRIWSQPWNGGKLLFLLNRYISPTQYLLQLLALDLPALSGSRCLQVYRLPYAATLYATAIAEIILILRTYALYDSSRRILAFLMSMFTAHVVVMVLAVVHAVPYPLPPGLIGCTLTGNGLLYVFFWAAPWIADSIIFALTLWRIVDLRRKSTVRLPLLHVLARDGILWYTVIVTIDAVNVLIFLLSPEGVKPMGAAFGQICMTVMISRLQLNLRAPGVRSSPSEDSWPDNSDTTESQTTPEGLTTMESMSVPGAVRPTSFDGSVGPQSRWSALRTFLRGTTASLGAPVNMNTFSLGSFAAAVEAEDEGGEQSHGDDIELRSLETKYSNQIIIGPAIKDSFYNRG